ncbi:hypothetical protein ACU6ZK_02290 [Klebsiella aerogenes]
MQEFKGKPGPWFRDNTRAIGPISTEDDQSYGMVIPVGWVEFDPEIEVQLANQQLMAAAPELLEALLSIVSMDYEPKLDGSDSVYLNARSAINKSLGK